METWYFVDSGHCTPAMNMALDEALMSWHRQGEIPPVLRFYGWAPAGLSVGYFQKVKGKIDLEGVERHGFDLVRRQTGGRAVLHDKELTYSVIVSEDHPDMPASVKDAYLVLSKGLLEGFHNLGIEAEFAVPEGKLDTTGSAVCFEEPSWYELIAEGRKAAGSAQTRKKGVILQHGSIPIDVDDVKLFDMFIYKNERIKERARRAFGDKAAAINQLLDKSVTFDQTKEAFREGFEKGLDIHLEPFELSDEQWKEVEKIAEERYRTEEWNFSR
ncbi:biotin/lipoate A/B protein ligase family protein [Halobacillus halophilus]|uniref:Octanoyltransferase LipM n=1 Tax=Halobacillus halophilus (strain ATCC 35676 / DSM 2266 / JCM 20832 / KCTC 3685 / LMG 17431 / NBRC 102448 / NCIMB 2269) TaxID=866895 RepID=I0JJX9_HALH3|nr:biotin/lipoate A/B protein ligase family protein [Halobacillus halophilus]ASF38598.1 biotin/lipoate A/B protein ligase family protein [Halobacillus halophilus]CCG44448.1 octanoyltransferase LipM [Halobacillus halophilus DSM 2266]